MLHLRDTLHKRMESLYWYRRRYHPFLSLCLETILKISIRFLMKYCFTKNILHSQQLLFFDLIIMLTFSGRENVVFKFFCLIYLMLSKQCFNRLKCSQKKNRSLTWKIHRANSCFYEHENTYWYALVTFRRMCLSSRVVSLFVTYSSDREWFSGLTKKFA